MCFLFQVPSPLAESIHALLGFQLGVFPAKFLGVPLITSKLSLADCQPLLEKILASISSWTTKFLSYTGRLILIKSVIFSIQSYWSSFFILPAAVLNNIKFIMCRFLWKGPSLLKYGAKVAWNKITRPLSEGGLAIKNLEEWNKALILLHLWRVVNSSICSIWAFWIRSNIKSKQFWCMPIPSECSWIWRKVLQLRPIAAKHIRFRIGNGKITSLWFDPWLSDLPLASSIHSPLISNSGLGPWATVHLIIRNSAWSLNYFKS